MTKTISKEDFKEKLDSKSCVLIDVRTQEEHDENKIAESEVFDVTKPDFSQKIDGLDRDNKYLIYCGSGVRSRQAMQTMDQMGFKEVYDLEGGIGAY